MINGHVGAQGCKLLLLLLLLVVLLLLLLLLLLTLRMGMKWLSSLLRHGLSPKLLLPRRRLPNSWARSRISGRGLHGVGISARDLRD